VKSDRSRPLNRPGVVGPKKKGKKKIKKKISGKKKVRRK